MIDRGHIYSIIKNIIEIDGDEYPIESDIEFWGKDIISVKWLISHMKYEMLILAETTEKEEWFNPFPFKPTYN